MEQNLSENLNLYMKSIQMEQHWELGLKQEINALEDYDTIDIQQTEEKDAEPVYDMQKITEIRQELASRPELMQRVHNQGQIKDLYMLFSEENKKLELQNVDEKA